jgi:hypothetical protein
MLRFVIGGAMLREGGQLLLRQLAGRLDDVALERTLGRGPLLRAIVEAMARGYRPEVTPGFRGAVVYSLTRSSGEAVTLTLEVGEAGCVASLRESADANPAGTRIHVRMPLADFLRIAAGQIDPAEPLLQGRATFTGELGLAARLAEMFGAPRLG